MSSSPRTIAIGDIHGCAHALDAVLDAIQPEPRDVLVVLGDFIDGGRDTALVVQRLLRLQEECHLVTLLGNHEEMFLRALTSETMRETWLMCGGMDTVNSYRYCGDIHDIPDEHVAFIRAARDYYETDEHIFVHANYDAKLPMEQQPGYLLRWALIDDPRPSPHVSGKTVIVGHTEQVDGEILDLNCACCIDTCCYGYGWLTALDVNTGQVWQASRWGYLRQGESVEQLRRAQSLMHA